MKHRTSLIISTVALLALAMFAIPITRKSLVGAQGQTPSIDELSKKVAALEKATTDIRKSDEESLKAISALSLTDPPVGTIMAYAGEFPPKRDDTRRWTEDELGWMTCNGRPLSVTTQKELFLAIGFSWGGSGTTFNLPDLGGRFLRGIDTGQNLDPDKADRRDKNGTRVGPVIGSLQGDEFKRHDHQIVDPGHSHGTNAQGLVREEVKGGDGASVNGWDNFDGKEFRASIQGNTTGISIKPEGTSNETRPKNAYVHFIIKFKSSRSLAP